MAPEELDLKQSRLARLPHSKVADWMVLCHSNSGSRANPLAALPKICADNEGSAVLSARPPRYLEKHPIQAPSHLPQTGRPT